MLFRGSHGTAITSRLPSMRRINKARDTAYPDRGRKADKKQHSILSIKGRRWCIDEPHARISRSNECVRVYHEDACR